MVFDSSSQDGQNGDPPGMEPSTPQSSGSGTETSSAARRFTLVPDERFSASLTYEVLTQPAEGRVTDHGDGTFTFDPAPNFQDLGMGETRQVSFTFQVSDGWGGRDTGSVAVSVTGGTIAPSLAVSYEALPGEASAPIAGAAEVAPSESGSGFDDWAGFRSDDAASAGEPDLASALALDEGGPEIAIPRTLPQDSAASQADDEGFAAVGEQSFAYAVPEVAGEGARYEILTPPAKGHAFDNGDGTFTFESGSDFQNLAVGEMAQASFTYRLIDGQGGSRTVTATVTIVGTDGGPLASDVSHRFDEAQDLAPEENAPAIEAATFEPGSDAEAPDWPLGDTIGADLAVADGDTMGVAEGASEFAKTFGGGFDPALGQAARTWVEDREAPQAPDQVLGHEQHFGEAIDGQAEDAAQSASAHAEAGLEETSVAAGGGLLDSGGSPEAEATHQAPTDVGAIETASGAAPQDSAVSDGSWYSALDEMVEEQGLKESAPAGVPAAGSQPAPAQNPHSETGAEDDVWAVFDNHRQSMSTVGGATGRIINAGATAQPSEAPAVVKGTVDAAQSAAWPTVSGEARQAESAGLESPGGATDSHPGSGDDVIEVQDTGNPVTDNMISGQSDNPFEAADNARQETLAPEVFAEQMPSAPVDDPPPVADQIGELDEPAPGIDYAGDSPVAAPDDSNWQNLVGETATLEPLDPDDPDVRSILDRIVPAGSGAAPDDGLDGAFGDHAGGLEAREPGQVFGAEPASPNLPDVAEEAFSGASAEAPPEESRQDGDAQPDVNRDMLYRSLVTDVVENGDAEEILHGDGRSDTLHLDGVTGGPGSGGWNVELNSGSILETNHDYLVFSKDAAGTILLDDSDVKISFQGVDRLEW